VRTPVSLHPLSSNEDRVTTLTIQGFPFIYTKGYVIKLAPSRRGQVPPKASSHTVKICPPIKSMINEAWTSETRVDWECKHLTFVLLDNSRVQTHRLCSVAKISTIRGLRHKCTAERCTRVCSRTPDVCAHRVDDFPVVEADAGKHFPGTCHCNLEAVRSWAGERDPPKQAHYLLGNSPTLEFGHGAHQVHRLQVAPTQARQETGACPSG
jgi:hypothetical protein